MKNYGKTLSQLIFMAAAFAFIMIISLGLTFDFSDLKTPIFWIIVGCKLVVAMIVYNIVIFLDQRNQLSNPETLLFQTLATNQLRVAEIYNKKVFKELEQAVERENTNEYIKECNTRLHNVTTRISYNDLFNEKTTKPLSSIEDLCDSFLLSKKKKMFIFKSQKERLLKVVKDIFSGNVKIEEVTAEELLKDKDTNKIPKNSLKYNSKAAKSKQNANKIFNFLISSVVTTAIGFAFVNPDIWGELVKNGLLFVGTIISGYTASYWEGKGKIFVFDYRNKFFKKELDIGNEYKI